MSACRAQNAMNHNEHEMDCNAALRLSDGDRTNSTHFMVKGFSFFLLFGTNHLLNYKNMPCPICLNPSSL